MQNAKIHLLCVITEQKAFRHIKINLIKQLGLNLCLDSVHSKLLSTCRALLNSQIVVNHVLAVQSIKIDFTQISVYMRPRALIFHYMVIEQHSLRAILRESMQFSSERSGWL